MSSERKIIDLTMMLQEGMQTFAAHWHPFVEITQLGRHGIENRETRKVIMGTHTGTHIDAPRHFIPQGQTVEELPLEQLVGPATVVDFSRLPDFYEITVEDLKKAVGERLWKRLVIRMDWDKKTLGTNRYYSDHAFFSEAACQYMIDQGLKLIALDTPQPDNPKNGRWAEKDAPNHKILLGQGAVIVEYLVDIRKISQPEVELVVAPLKLKEGDGAPVRCFAIENG